MGDFRCRSPAAGKSIFRHLRRFPAGLPDIAWLRTVVLNCCRRSYGMAKAELDPAIFGFSSPPAPSLRPIKRNSIFTLMAATRRASVLRQTHHRHRVSTTMTVLELAKTGIIGHRSDSMTAQAGRFAALRERLSNGQWRS